MSEPQHPQPHDTDTNAGRPSPVARAVVQPVVQPELDSLAAVGARLTQLRESKGWSVEDVSARLKVAPPKLRALEAGDISHLPDATFALGVIRSYAKMMGADPTPFTQVLRREKNVGAPTLSMPASSGADLPRGRVSLSLGGGAQKSRSWLWGVAAVIVAVIALGMWHTNGGDSTAWLARLKASANGGAESTGGGTAASGAVAQGPSAGSDASGQAVASEPVAQMATQTTTQTASSGTPMPVPLTAGNAPASAAPVTATSGARAASAPAAVAGIPAGASAPVAAPAGSSVIALRVTQDSWLSVRGKDGKEVFSGLVHAGDTKEVTGAAPLKVTLGNKAGLESITLDGQPVDPSKYATAKGNVARFALP